MRRIEAERPLMDDWCERESMWFLDVLCRDPGGMGPGSADEWLVAGGAVERMSVPARRGSESNRVHSSVDAQTCCPFSAFTSYVSQDAVRSPDVSNGGVRSGAVIAPESA